MKLLKALNDLVKINCNLCYLFDYCPIPCLLMYQKTLQIQSVSVNLSLFRSFFLSLFLSFILSFILFSPYSGPPCQEEISIALKGGNKLCIGSSQTSPVDATLPRLGTWAAIPVSTWSTLDSGMGHASDPRKVIGHRHPNTVGFAEVVRQICVDGAAAEFRVFCHAAAGFG